MKALIFKDFRILIPNYSYKVLLYFGGMIFFSIFLFGLSIAIFTYTFLLFFLLFLVPMIENRTKFEEYALTLPVNRFGYVKTKYMELGIVFIVSTILMGLEAMIINIFGQAADTGVFISGNEIATDLYQAFGIPFSIFIMPSVCMILFSIFNLLVTKFGIQRGGQIFWLTAILMMPTYVLDLTTTGFELWIFILRGYIHFPHALGFVPLVIAIATFFISYVLAQRIAKNRDF